MEITGSCDSNNNDSLRCHSSINIDSWHLTVRASHWFQATQPEQWTRHPFYIFPQSFTPRPLPQTAAVVLPWGPFPAQSPQGLSYAVIPCTFPDDLGPFFSQLVPTALEQALDLHQLSILEDVSRGLLAAPGLR